MSRDLRNNTDQYVTVGPFIDQGDGKTLKNDLTVTNIKGIFSIQTQTSAATDSDEFTCDATAANDWGLASQGHGGLYQLKIPDSVINFVGSGFLSLYYATSYLPVWHEFRVLPANVYDALKGTDALQIDVIQVNGVAQTATLDTIKADTEAIKVPTDKLVFTVANQVDSNVITKTGFALSATGLDLILKGSIFVQAIAAAINELATYGLTALNTLLVTTGIKAATIPAVTLAANQDVRNISGTLPNVTLAATQASYAPAKVADLGVVQSADNNTKLTAIQADYARRTGDYSTYAGGDSSGVTTLLTRLSAVRAGYLDLLNTYLDSATSAIKTVVDAIKVVTDKFRFTVTNQVDANTLTGGSGLDAAGVRSAVGLATANLDTQLAALPTDADVNAACDTAISDAGIPAAAAALILVTPAQKLGTDSSGRAAANVKAVNDVTLTGDGSTTPWGPA